MFCLYHFRAKIHGVMCYLHVQKNTNYSLTFQEYEIWKFARLKFNLGCPLYKYTDLLLPINALYAFELASECRNW